MNRILIVEDESRLAAFVEKGLRKNGFSTAIAADGEQALLMAQSDEFDLLLLDLGLPIKDGWTVLEELRSQGQQIPVIIVTAHDQFQDRIADKQEGANGYVTKPFRFQDLLAQVHSKLNDST